MESIECYQECPINNSSVRYKVFQNLNYYFKQFHEKTRKTNICILFNVNKKRISRNIEYDINKNK